VPRGVGVGPDEFDVNPETLNCRQRGMADCPRFSLLIFQGPNGGLSFSQFPAAQRCGGWGDGLECSQPAIPGEYIRLQKEGDAVASVEVGARLFTDDGSLGSGLGETLQGLEDSMVGWVIPRKVGE